MAKLKNKVKQLFLRGFYSQNLQHPLFDASKTEAKRLMISKRGLEEIKQHDKKLYRATSQYVREKQLTAKEFAKQIDRWVGQLRIRSGDTKTTLRKPGRVHHSLTKSGSVGRPLDLIHMDLANVERLNPDKRKYRYPYILVAVDAFSNYTVLVPVRNKSANVVLKGVETAFNSFGLDERGIILPKGRNASKAILGEEDEERRNDVKCMVTTRVQTDRGKEFINGTLQKFLKSRNVELFTSRGSGKAYLAESKIGQMKRQLVRIQEILEREASKKSKGRKSKKVKISSSKRRGQQSQKDDDFSTYKDDWTRYLKELQEKINSKKNTRTGFSPKELFQRFTNDSLSSRRDWEKRNRVNETKTHFEPIQDTLIKMELLRRAQMTDAKQRRALKTAQDKDKKRNKQHRWRPIAIGTTVYLTHSRLKSYPNEQPLNMFEKKSTQTKSEWDTSKPYVVDHIYNDNETSTPKRYRVRNAKSGLLRKTLYYREELLSKKDAKKLYK